MARDMNNPVDVVAELRNTYARERGQRRGSGDPIPVSQMYPNTSYADVMVIGLAFGKWLDKGDFVRTTNYYAARHYLRLMMPDKAIVDEFVRQGLSKDAAEAEVAIRIKTTTPDWPGQTYEANELFWGAMERAAIARYASGRVPSRWELTKSAVVDSIKDLPGRLSGALFSILPDLSLPGLGLGNIMKWSMIAGGAYLLYVLWKKKR